MGTVKSTIIIYFSFGFIFNIFTGKALASQGDFEEMKKIEEELSPKAPRMSIERPKVEYVAKDLRDPFNPGGLTQEKAPEQKFQKTEMHKEEPPSLSVQGLVWGGSLPQAIINHKVVKEGDTVEGAKIIKIDKEGITVFFKGGQYNLGNPKKEDRSKKQQGGKNESNH